MNRVCELTNAPQIFKLILSESKACIPVALEEQSIIEFICRRQAWPIE